MTDSGIDPRIGEHDWQSYEYVEQWITRDVTRDEERRPVLRQMLSLARFPKNAEITVLDVGAGYGIVSEEALKLFPNARVTLQDYSAAMFEHARRTLARFHERARFVIADLTNPAWTAAVGGPFDLIASGLAIHNLRTEASIRASYDSIGSLLKPEGSFLDYDLFGIVTGGVETQRRWLHECGFKQVQFTYQKGPIAVLRASLSL